MTTPTLDRDVLASLHGKSLMLTTDWSAQELETLLNVAARFAARDRAGESNALIPNELGYAVFFDNSTRTKSAWAGAVTRLGMNPVIVDGSSTQVAHGETAVETGAMLGMNAHAMGIRHDLILGEGNTFMRDVEKGISDYLAATDNARKVPLVNLQCDIDHPTQSLADLSWLREHFSAGRASLDAPGRASLDAGPDAIRGKKIGVSWAYSPSYAKPLSVPQGLITLLTRFGADVTLAHPKGYELMPSCMQAAAAQAKESGGSFKTTNTMDEAFEGAHVVYPKSWGPYDLMLERVDANREADKARMGEIEQRALTRNADFTDWICDERRMALTDAGDALYMHCLPADIGAEVTEGVMEKHRVNLAREANWKVYVIMALLAVAKVPSLETKLG